MPVDQLGVSAPDPRTVVIELERPTAYILDILAFFPSAVVPRHAIEPHGQQWTTPANIVTSGGYTLAEWVPNTHIRLRRNQHHYDAANIRIPEIIYYPVELPEAALTRYRAGDYEKWVRACPTPYGGPALWGDTPAARERTARRLAWVKWTKAPALRSLVTCATSTSGCASRRRRSSPPV